MSTLVERAKKVDGKRKRKNSFNQEEFDLAVAYFGGEINLNQAAKALSFSVKQIYTKLCYIFVAGYREGKFVLKK